MTPAPLDAFFTLRRFLNYGAVVLVGVAGAVAGAPVAPATATVPLMSFF
jgi:hypothetical protein